MNSEVINFKIFEFLIEIKKISEKDLEPKLRQIDPSELDEKFEKILLPIRQ